MEACQHRRHKVRMENSNPKIINDRNIWHNSNNRQSAENNPHDSITDEVRKALTNTVVSTSYEQLLKMRGRNMRTACGPCDTAIRTTCNVSGRRTDSLVQQRGYRSQTNNEAQWSPRDYSDRLKKW